VAEVNVMAKKEDKQQFADILLLLISIQSLVALKTIEKKNMAKFTNFTLASEQVLPDCIGEYFL